jgi:ribosomal protein L37E
MLETNAPQSKTLQRVCIRCGDTHTASLSQCEACGFDLTSDLQRDYDFYRHGVPLDAPTGVGERQAKRDAAAVRRRHQTQPGTSGKAWRPYRETRASGSSASQATMDLGAAVLEAVFEPTPAAPRGTLDMGAVGPFMLDTPASVSADPVGWSPTSAPHVEAPVVVGTPSGASVSEDSLELPTAEPYVVGVVHDWSMAPVSENVTLGTRPRPSAPRQVRTSGAANYAPPQSPPGPTEAVTAPEISAASVETLLTERVTKTEPVSRRNHIRRGATTYVDAVQGSVRRNAATWWQRDAATPLAVATGLVVLVIFALM